MEPDDKQKALIDFADIFRKQQSLNGIPSPQYTPENVQSALEGATGGVAKTLPSAGITAAFGGPPGWAAAGAQVLAGLVGGIFGAKKAQKDREAAKIEAGASRAQQIAQQGQAAQSAALESLMRKL